MKAQENQFLPFLNGKKQFIIPIYQRAYSWQREQCEQLWNDIIRAGADQEMPGHFIGSIVYIQQGIFLFGDVPQFLLIDGQQRLTTLLLLLTALAEKAQNEPGSTDVVYKEDIYDSYLVNKFGKDEQRYKLLLTETDRELLKKLIDHPEKIVSNDSKISIPLVDNYIFFREQLQSRDSDLNTILSGLNKLTIVEISLNKDHDNPQLIFESLNSTGMDLSQADLIRNYVLMGLDSDKQIQIYKEYWYPIEQKFRYEGKGDAFDRFMRDYLTLKRRSIPNIDKVYTTFKQYHQSRHKSTIEEIVKDIALYAEYYANMAFLHEKDHDIKLAMHDINALKVDVAYPFLLEIYADYKQNKLKKTDLVAILRLIESYVFRRTICSIPTNTLNKIFIALSEEIDKENYLESIQAALYAKLGSGHFPRDDEFRVAFVTKDIYTSSRRNYLLNRLENHHNKLENHHYKELASIVNYTIEHVMPQNSNLSEVWQQELGPGWKDIQTRYLHTIGNLTLTGYNSELSDRSFYEKRTMDGGFDHSPLNLNRSLAHLQFWNQQAIEKRAQDLAESAIKIWAIPAISVELINKYSRKQDRKALQEDGKENYLEKENTNGSRTYTINDHVHLQGNMLTLFDELRKRILNLSINVNEEFKKHYVAYKLTTNFVDVEVQKNSLSLTMNIPFQEIDDPQGICEDVTNIGHHGNGQVRLRLTALNQLDGALYIIQQSFDRQNSDVVLV